MDKIQTIYSSKFRIVDSIASPVTGETIPCIQGQLSQTGVISQNGYRYRDDFWDIINSDPIQELIKNRDMLGMIEHPADDNEYLKTPYEKASHVVLSAWIDDNGDPFGTFGLLNNEHGNAIKALTDIGHRPGVSTRGLGEYLKDSVSEYVSPENYMLITWDLVRSPNFATLKMDKVSDSLKSNPKFKELLQMYHLRDSVDESYSREKLRGEMESMIQEMTRIKNALEKL